MSTDKDTYTSVVKNITNELLRLQTDEERVALLAGAMFTIFHVSSHEIEGEQS